MMRGGGEMEGGMVVVGGSEGGMGESGEEMVVGGEVGVG